QDDVADHEKFHAHFNCDRIIHQDDVTEDTSECEMILSSGQRVELSSDLKVIFTPGHTKGHMVLLYKSKFLFTGDHLFTELRSSELRASRRACWYSWKDQITSMEKLSMESFEWVLPGHGGWKKFNSSGIKNSLCTLITRMKQQL